MDVAPIVVAVAATELAVVGVALLAMARDRRPPPAMPDADAPPSTGPESYGAGLRPVDADARATGPIGLGGDHRPSPAS